MRTSTVNNEQRTLIPICQVPLNDPRVRKIERPRNMPGFIQFVTPHVQQNKIICAARQGIMNIPAVSLEREPTLEVSQRILR